VKTLSVITVSFNAADHIEDCIRSVRRQGYRPIEHVVVDGGSVDGTLKIVERYADGIARWVSEPDGGPFHAMNKGLSLSTGDVVFFLNADDRFVDDRVADDVMTAFNGDGGLEALFGDQVFDLPGERRVKEQPDRVTRRKLARTTIQHQTLFAGRGLFQRAGVFREDLKVVSDYEWILRAFLRHRCRYRHLAREISVMGTGGISWRTEYEDERLAVMNEYFSPVETWLYRTVPLKFEGLHQALRRLLAGGGAAGAAGGGAGR
jgi:glycosyltransferase involved in cell wall biosynthesis